MATASPGRSCPTACHDGRAVFHRPPELEAGTLYAASGLYRNPLAALERAVLVFNGDFHWFDAEPDWFAQVQAGALRPVGQP